jgi:hypothetical protein
MNSYLIFTEQNCYTVNAHYSFDAVRKVEQVTGERVTAWDVRTGPIPRNVKDLTTLTIH